MIAQSVHLGLSGPPHGVRVDESVSVSALESEAETPSTNEKKVEVSSDTSTPPGASEVTDHG